jgi:hypothetical protein
MATAATITKIATTVVTVFGFDQKTARDIMARVRRFMEQSLAAHAGEHRGRLEFQQKRPSKTRSG